MKNYGFKPRSEGRGGACTPMAERRRFSLGYKVCYREQGDKRYVRHFLTYTYQQAVRALHYYIRDPPPSREDGHILKKPKWKIVPVSRKEIKAGIWRECPF